MSVRVPITVSANTAGTHVQVDIATTTDGVNHPPHASKHWRRIALISNGDLPDTVLTSPRPRGTYVWSRTSAWEDGLRVSNYSDPEVTFVPVLPGFDALTLDFGDSDSTHTLTWTGNAELGGVHIRWSVDRIDEEAALDQVAHVADTPASYEIDSLVAVGERLSVTVTAWSDHDGILVAGKPGEVVEFEEERPGAVTGENPYADLACRVLLDDDHSLILDDDHCLILLDPALETDE